MSAMFQIGPIARRDILSRLRINLSAFEREVDFHIQVLY